MFHQSANFWRSIAVACAAALAIGCGGDEVADGAECIPGEATICLCDDLSFGARECGDDQIYGRCQCSGSPVDGDASSNSSNNSDPDGGSVDPNNVSPNNPPNNTTPDTDAGPDAEPPPVSFNICGGTAELDGVPGSVCGECNDGVIVCDGLDRVRCAFASQRNACDSCGELDGAVGDPCGPCKTGSLECSGAGILECVGAAEPNACGGCSSLTDEPGFFCQSANGEPGSFACDSPDSVRCTAPNENACGGLTVLSDAPATPCGTCDDGRFVCVGQDAVICDGASAGQNSCGGCGTPLVGEPGQACGACGGVWECDGTQGVTCSQRINVCGGCVELAENPGDDCGGGEIVTCDGSLATTCRDAATHNACGGTNSLANAPGAPCGACGDGRYMCAGGTTTVCVEDELEINDCGGCALLNAVPGEPCAPGQIWTCDGPDRVICELAPPPSNGLNACGGTQMLDGQPGTVCEECGTWACDTVNRDLVFCVGGSPGTLQDENNCGMCGVRCVPGETCVAGQCEFDTVVEIDGSAVHAIARMAGGAVFVWGYNDRTGPVGNGSTAPNILEPTQTSVINDAIAVAAVDSAQTNGAGTSCAIRASGEVWCWGSNFRGQLGTPSSLLRSSTIPIRVAGISDAIQIEGNSDTVCALKNDRTLWCWGDNSAGQLGRGTIGGSEPTPAQVTGLSSVQDFAVTADTVCAVTTTGEAYCWGSDRFAQLGNGALDIADQPTPQLGDGTFSAFSAIDPFQLGFVALNADGAYMWGRGPRPSSSEFETQASPYLIAGTAGALRVFGAHDNLYVETSPGVVKMWGDDNGQSGVLTSSGRVYGIEIGPIPSGTSIVDVDGISLGAFVVMDDGSVWTSGSGFYLGDGQNRSLNNSRITTRQWHPVRRFLPVGSELGACRDGADNDKDGLTDCEDPDCADDVGSVEGPGAISDIADIQWYRYFDAECSSTAFHREQTYAWTAPRTATYEVTSGASAARLTLEAFDTCLASALPLSCDATALGTSGNPSRIEFSAIGGQTYYIVAHAQSGGAVSLDINEVP
jgi:hypothetical protein